MYCTVLSCCVPPAVLCVREKDVTKNKLYAAFFSSCIRCGTGITSSSPPLGFRYPTHHRLLLWSVVVVETYVHAQHLQELSRQFCKGNSRLYHMLQSIHEEYMCLSQVCLESLSNEWSCILSGMDIWCLDVVGDWLLPFSRPSCAGFSACLLPRYTGGSWEEHLHGWPVHALLLESVCGLSMQYLMCVFVCVCLYSVVCVFVFVYVRVWNICAWASVLFWFCPWGGLCDCTDYDYVANKIRMTRVGFDVKSSKMPDVRVPTCHAVLLTNRHADTPQSSQGHIFVLCVLLCCAERVSFAVIAWWRACGGYPCSGECLGGPRNTYSMASLDD